MSVLQFPTGSKVLYESGYVRRLNTAVRMNVLDGARQLSHDVLMQASEEFGADGVEISAHALCAPDHLPYQGLQFSNESFERLQRDLPRPFMQWNCKHTTFPIIMGISERTYSNEELAEFRQYSNEELEYDGQKYSRYEMSQLMRQCETSIRGQKNIALAAKAAGDTQLRREAQAKINSLKTMYADITHASGLQPRKDLMSVSGFKAVKTVEPLTKELTYDTIDLSDNDDYIRYVIQSDAINKTILEGQQKKHIPESKGYIKGRSYITCSLDGAQNLVNTYAGTGEIKRDKKGLWNHREVASADYDIGFVLDEDGNSEATNKFTIHYAKGGTHIVPAKRRDKL